MIVEYDDHMGSDLKVVNAARASFGKKITEMTARDVALIHYLARGMDSLQWSKFAAVLADTHDVPEIQRIVEAFKRQPQHWAPFAHPHISIRVQTSIAMARQMVKHQIGFAWSEESRRYVDDAPEFEEIEFRKRAENVKQGSAAETGEYPTIRIMDREGVTRFFDYSEVQLGLAQAYRRAVNPEMKYNIAPECARMTLPLSLKTSWLWTGSLSAWARMLNARLDGHAQKEAQEIAQAVRAIILPLFPVSLPALIGE
jgi:thymidylate synthase (FAD)